MDANNFVIDAEANEIDETILDQRTDEDYPAWSLDDFEDIAQLAGGFE